MFYLSINKKVPEYGLTMSPQTNMDVFIFYFIKDASFNLCNQKTIFLYNTPCFFKCGTMFSIFHKINTCLLFWKLDVYVQFSTVKKVRNNMTNSLFKYIYQNFLNIWSHDVWYDLCNNSFCLENSEIWMNSVKVVIVKIEIFYTFLTFLTKTFFFHVL